MFNVSVDGAPGDTAAGLNDLITAGFETTNNVATRRHACTSRRGRDRSRCGGIASGGGAGHGQCHGAAGTCRDGAAGEADRRAASGPPPVSVPPQVLCEFEGVALSKLAG